MKHIRILLLTTLFFTPFLLPAQSWFEGNPQWVNRYTSGWSSGGYEYVSIYGDTILDGHSAKVLKRFIDKNIGDDITWYKPVRQNGDTIWGWEYSVNKFLMYYNFSLGVGDTLVVPPYWAASFSLIYVIDSIGTMNVGGHSLRFQRVYFPESNNNYQWVALIIEKIGMVSGLFTNTNTNYTSLISVHFFLDEPCTIASDGSCWFFCRFQNDQFMYEISNSECDGLVDIPESSENPAFTVSPNPFQDYFTISSPPGEKIASLRLFDMNGKVVFQISNPAEIKIHAGDLQPGMYFLEIMTSDQKRYFSKLTH